MLHHVLKEVHCPGERRHIHILINSVDTVELLIINHKRRKADTVVRHSAVITAVTCAVHYIRSAVDIREDMADCLFHQFEGSSIKISERRLHTLIKHNSLNTIALSQFADGIEPGREIGRY